MSSDTSPVPRSLVWATDLDVLPLSRVIVRRPGFLLIRSPSNPDHYWGNYLLFDRAPVAGDALRWEAAFDELFGDEPRVRHRTFAWDRTDGVAGVAQEEFASRGYDIEESIGLVADAQQLSEHPRENRDVVVRPLDPAADAILWDAVLELQVAGRDDRQEEKAFRSFASARLEDLRALFRAGRGAWYVAIEPTTGAVAASCGVVVTAGRGRFQIVETAPAHRRRGICSRLVVEAARRARADHGAVRFVIVADPGYHALGLYESLGFVRGEHVFGVCSAPRADAMPRRPSPLE
jgi:ribosomal protein S18 acetylase RimI-like enzyme